ncbi:MAG: hypothetical protein ABIP30_05175 [Ferruginibacter sp.]
MKHILSISIAVLLLASCQKSNNDLTAPSLAGIPKIKTFVISDTKGIINSVAIEYDDAGRFSRGVYKDGHSIKYTYASNKVTMESFTAANVSDSKGTYVLNGDGLVIKYYNNAYPAFVTHFTYTKGKKILTEINENNNDTTYQLYHTYNAAGNLIADSIINGSITTTKKIEYYTDKISTIENPNSGISFYGIPGTNCPKQSSVKLSTSNYTHTDFNIPETDAMGRITKSVYTSQGETYTSLYTYY